MKNKVCILSSGHSACDHRIFYKEACSLAKNGYEVILIARNNCEEIKNDIKIIPLKIKANNKMARFFSLYRLLKLAWEQNADIYHFHDPDLLIAGLVLKVFKRSKVIYDVHEFYSKAIMDKEWIPSQSLRTITSLLYGVFEKNISRLFDGVLLVVNKQRDLFHKNVLSEVLYNYPLIDRNNNNYQAKRKGNKIIYMGTLTEVRGIFFLVESFKLIIERIPSAMLILGGEFHNNVFKNKIFDFIRENNLNDNIQYIGQVPYKDVKNYLRISDIGVVPVLTTKKNSGLSTKMFEFMQAKIPVVHKDLPHIRDYIIGNNCGLMVKRDCPKDFADAIIQLLEDKEMRTIMGENGYQAHIQYYNWGIEEKKLINFYQKVSNK